MSANPDLLATLAQRPRLLPVLFAVALTLAGPAKSLAAGDGTDHVEFRVNSESTWLRVLVYRGGLLRRLGHNHVVSHDGITGTIMVGHDPLQSRIDLEFAVTGLVVDEPEQRTVTGPDFPGQISEQDVAGTRANMLGRKMLQAERFPFIHIRSKHITGSMPELEIDASVTVRDAEYSVVFPANVELSGDSFIASGELEVTHADFGLKPFKAALGTLRVRDTLVLQYEISGTRIRRPSHIHFIL